MRIPDRRIWLAGILVVAYAFVAVGGSTAGRTGAAFAIVGGLLGIVGVAVLLWSPPQPLGSSWSHIPGVIGILLVLVLLILIGRAWPFGIQALLVSGPMAILFLPSSRGDAHRMWLVAVAVVAVPIVLIPVASTGLAEQPDVQMAHRAAGDAFREGLNPYVAVSVEDTSPYASDGAMIEALWNGVLGVHVDRWVIRPESLSIAAFGVFLGSPIILSVVLALILLLGRRVRDMGSLYLMGAASMAVITILSPQSFANYWYIVVAFMLLAITERWRVLGDEKVPGADPPYSAVTRTTPLA